MDLGKVVLTLCVIPCIALLWRFLELYWWHPKSIATKLARQSIRGPPPKFMMGNLAEIVSLRGKKSQQPMDKISHDIVGHSLPDYAQYAEKYGSRYVYWWGREPRVTICEPELIRDVFAKRLSTFDKSDLMVAGVVPLVGRGLVAVRGEEWSVHRRVVAPAFYVEKLKMMPDTISDCANKMVDAWETRIQNEPELEVCDEFQKVTADIISHTAFGSSYARGQRVFQILHAIPQLQRKLFKFLWIPYFRYLPLPVNLKVMALEKELNAILLGLIRDRKEMVKCGRSTSYGNDLLGLLLAESENENGSILNDRSIADECRTFYLAGHETTASLLSWTVMLLAIHPEWQERARAEVFADDASPGDAFNKFKLMKMIFNEVLRLYPPIMIMSRGCSEDSQLGDFHIPKGAALSVPVLAIHRSTELWGPDANEFKPERFRDGISGACKHPNAFLPFSLGPRVCVGQAFALLEGKLVMAAILRRFSFRLSASYRHNPCPVVTLIPYNGLPVVFTKLSHE